MHFKNKLKQEWAGNKKKNNNKHTYIARNVQCDAYSLWLVSWPSLMAQGQKYKNKFRSLSPSKQSETHTIGISVYVCVRWERESQSQSDRERVGSETAKSLNCPSFFHVTHKLYLFRNSFSFIFLPTCCLVHFAKHQISKKQDTVTHNLRPN